MDEEMERYYETGVSKYTEMADQIERSYRTRDYSQIEPVKTDEEFEELMQIELGYQRRAKA